MRAASPSRITLAVVAALASTCLVGAGCSRSEAPAPEPAPPAAAADQGQAAAEEPAPQPLTPPTIDPSWITARELAAAGARAPTLIDVRPKDAFDAFHVPGALSMRPHELKVAAAVRAGATVVIGHGADVEKLAERVAELRDQGRDIRLMSGGMQAWCRLPDAKVAGFCRDADQMNASLLFTGLRSGGWAALVALPLDDPQLEAHLSQIEELLPEARIVAWKTPDDILVAAREAASGPAISQLAVLDADGKSREALRDALGAKLDLHTYYVDEGLKGYADFLDRQTAMWNRRTIVSQGQRGTSKRDRGVVRAPKGCGCL